MEREEEREIYVLANEKAKEDSYTLFIYGGDVFDVTVYAYRNKKKKNGDDDEEVSSHNGFRPSTLWAFYIYSSYSWLENCLRLCFQ